MAPVSKKKRSNTVKRCSAHATGLTFESVAPGDEYEGIEDVENAPGIDGEVKEDDQDGSDSDNGNVGNEDMEEGGGSDSEKGNEVDEDTEDGALGLNSGWSDRWSGEGMSMDSILEKARQMVAEMSKPEAGSAKSVTEKAKPSEEAVMGVNDQNGKKKRVFAMNLDLYL